MRPVRVYALRPETIAVLPAPSLPLVVAKARQPEEQELAGLDELFRVVSKAAPQNGNGGSGTGHPLHAHAMADEAARVYIARHGDPLEIGVAISALPILAEGVLERLRKVLGFDTKAQAAKFWAEVYSATLPFIHQRLGRLIARSPSASGVEPVGWTLSDDGDLVDVTPNPAAREDEATEHC